MIDRLAALALLSLASPSYAFWPDLAENFAHARSLRFQAASCAARPEATQARYIAPRSPAPDFRGKDLLGLELGLSDFRRRIVILDFWASWCGPCKETAPVLEKLHRRYAASGLAVIGINEDDNQEAARAFAHGERLSYPSVFDAGHAIQSEYGVRVMPTFVMIDANGLMVGAIQGAPGNLEQMLETELLKQLKALKP